jgi:hypothetical protein
VHIFVYALIPIAAYLLGNWLSVINMAFFKKAIFILGIAQAIWGILQIYSDKFRIFSLTSYANFDKYNYGFENWRVGRVVGTIGNPNTYGVFIVLIAVFIVTVLITQYNQDNARRKITTILSIAMFFLCAYAIVLSQSRTAYVLLAFGLILSVIYNTRGNKKIIKIALLLIIFVILYFYIPFISRRFGYDSFLSIGSRVPIWEMFIDNYINNMSFHFLIGYGSDYVSNIGKSVDNYYLLLLLKYGLVGLLSYCVMVFAIFKSFTNIKMYDIKIFLTISYMLVLISDITGTINQHSDMTIFLFIIFGYCNNYKVTIVDVERVKYQDNENINNINTISRFSAAGKV